MSGRAIVASFLVFGVAGCARTIHREVPVPDGSMHRDKMPEVKLVVSEAPAHERTYVDKMVREGQYRLNELGAISATFHLDSERRDLTTTIQYNGKSLKVTRCRIIVNFGPDVSRIAAIEAIRKSDFRILSEGRPDQVIPYYSYVLLIPNEMGIEEAMEKAGRIPGIAEVEPNAVGEWY